jgi:RNA polymerase sigma-70 factor (ECF subfamily)
MSSVKSHPAGTTRSASAGATTGSPDGATPAFSAAGEPRQAAPSRELLERARRREPEALQAFFDHYFPRVHRVVFRLVGERTQAEDLTQETFLKVHRAIDRLNPALDPSSWLIAIAANTCRDHWRSGGQRMARRARPIDEEVVGRVASPAGGPEEHLIARERERLVQKAITALPEPLRMVVVLHDFGGLPHDEVAAIAGIRGTAARKRYSRALRLLAERLKELIPS